MESLKRVWKVGKAAKVANEVVGFVTSELVKPWLYPLAGAALTALSAFLGAVPPPYLLAATFVSAAVATLLVRVDEWRERTSPNGRLAVANLFIAPVMDGDQAPPFLRARLRRVTGLV